MCLNMKRKKPRQYVDDLDIGVNIGSNFKIMINMLKEVEKKIENFLRELEPIKGNESEIQKPKNTLIVFHNSSDWS